MRPSNNPNTFFISINTSLSLTSYKTPFAPTKQGLELSIFDFAPRGRALSSRVHVPSSPIVLDGIHTLRLSGRRNAVNQYRNAVNQYTRPYTFLLIQHRLNQDLFRLNSRNAVNQLFQGCSEEEGAELETTAPGQKMLGTRWDFIERNEAGEFHRAFLLFERGYGVVLGV